MDHSPIAAPPPLPPATPEPPRTPCPRRRGVTHSPAGRPPRTPAQRVHPFARRSENRDRAWLRPPHESSPGNPPLERSPCFPDAHTFLERLDPRCESLLLPAVRTLALCGPHSARCHNRCLHPQSPASSPPPRSGPRSPPSPTS